MSTTESFRHPEFLVETDALEQRLGDPGLRILDCTTHLVPDPKITYQVVPGRADFEKGHIPGAQFVDLQSDLSDNNHRFRFMLPSAEAFAAAMSGFGVGEGTRVVLYSTANPWWATRVWWMLRIFGFDDAAVLNGGWQKWSREGRPVETGPAKSHPPGHFVVREQRPLMVGKEDGPAGDRQRRGLHDQCSAAGAARRHRRQQLRQAWSHQGQRQSAGGTSARSRDQRIPARRRIARALRGDRGLRQDRHHLLRRGYCRERRCARSGHARPSRCQAL